MEVIDVWTIAAVCFLPLWIGSFAYAGHSFLEWSFRHHRFGFAIFMGVGVPAMLIAVGVPISILARHMDRSREYRRCVVHENAIDPMNDCDQEWVDKWRNLSPKPPIL